jgi:transposase InsO family protein
MVSLVTSACKHNGMKHITSSLYHPSSNGLAECAVRTVKEGLVKMKEGSIVDRLSRFLLSYRNIPQ